MKILLASAPATGHLNPLLAIGRFLIAEGHEVAFLSGSAPVAQRGAATVVTRRRQVGSR